MSDDRNILDFIRSLCAKSETGRLEILAGAIQGELTFADGKLIDARVGHLTGFRAVNAVAAMRDARFSFDPAYAPVGSSSITASERVVLKQFFGIETQAAGQYFDPNFEPTPVNLPQAAVPVSEVDDEVTIVGSNVIRDEIPTLPPPPVSRFSPRAVPASRFAPRAALAFAVLALALIAAGAVLVYRFYQRGPSPVVAVASTPTRSDPAPEVVKRDEKPVKTARDLSGKWNVVNTVETTSYGSFKNMKIGFNLSINQTGTNFTGSGQKVSENGRSLPVSSRTPIQVKGSVKGDTIEATFFEEGTARKSNGRFVWRIDQAGRGLTGNFATTAARSSGKSAAIRL